MFTELHIRDVGVLRDVTLELDEGLTVITGETGAGKTMVVASLELLLGARADADAVRPGAASALVEARLAPPPAAAAPWLDLEDEELVVAREVAPARSRARIGGRLAPASALAEVVGAAVEVHGQRDTARLAAPAVQRELLDRAGGAGLAATAGTYRLAYDAWRAAADELAELQRSEAERLREADRLAFELAEVDSLAPAADEGAALEGELARLEHAEVLGAGARAAAAAVADDGGARDALGAAVAALRAAAGHDSALDELARRAEGLAAEAQEIAFDLSAYADALEVDPARLAVLRDRFAGLVRLSRKYGAAPGGALDLAGVVAWADEARTRLALLAGGEARAAALIDDVAALEAAARTAADQLHAARRAAGDALTAAVEAHLAELALPGARFQVAVEPVDPGPTGADRVTFLLAANAGSPPLPLGKAASGGERSRVALALRLALADADDVDVLVFDEIDAGIGGATGLAVGRKLAALARGRQVLCVTHLAQIAAFADQHVVVTKDPDAAVTVASVRVLDDNDRVDELSRMLSGTPGSVAATVHARELLTLARGRAVAPAAPAARP